jgi:hypothetical protein
MIAWKSTMIRLLAAAAVMAASTMLQAQHPLCTPTTPLTPLAGVGEASGLAVSRRTPGVVWTHNDSGGPVLFAFDTSGKPRGRVRVAGAVVVDWEDLAIGRCAEGSCLYLADIGDNNRERRSITIYRVPEPRPEDKTTATAEPIRIAYDKPRDAEALFVGADGDLFIVSKEDGGATTLFRVNAAQESDPVRKAVAVKTLSHERVTGAAVSPDGDWVALRTNTELFLYRTQDLIGGREVEPLRVDLSDVREPQGEGVAFGDRGVVYLAGEGGGAGGTLAALECNLR